MSIPSHYSESTILECDGIDMAGVRVLVVEDEADARELIKRVLAQCHAEVLTAAMIAGYQIHIAKPIEPQELIATVASLAGRTARNLDQG